MKSEVVTGPAVWDVVVIGAGPAGSVVAYQLAQTGLRVLLTERRQFPRPKVCGGCLNTVALRTLDDCQLLPVAVAASGATLERLCLRAAGRSLEVPIPRGMAICRSAFDSGLAAAAAQQGASVAFGTQARVLPGGTVASDDCLSIELQVEDHRQIVNARTVVLAAGLDSARRIAPHLLITHAASKARVGLGTILDTAPSEVGEHVVCMNVASRSYVGAVRLGDGRAVLAAAIDHRLLRRAMNPESAVRHILRRCDWNELAEMPLPHLQGTPTLTRSLLKPAADRLFVIGDAAGYVEPFTGDGMAVALKTAVAVVPFVVRAVEHWETSIAQGWCREHRRLIAARHTWCRGFSQLMRHSFLVRAAAFTAEHCPSLSRHIALQVVGAS